MQMIFLTRTTQVKLKGMHHLQKARWISKISNNQVKLVKDKVRVTISHQNSLVNCPFLISHTIKMFIVKEGSGEALALKNKITLFTKVVRVSIMEMGAQEKLAGLQKFLHIQGAKEIQNMTTYHNNHKHQI